MQWREISEVWVASGQEEELVELRGEGMGLVVHLRRHPRYFGFRAPPLVASAGFLLERRGVAYSDFCMWHE